MRILITGATGFIGRHLYESLKEKYELFILTRKPSDSTKINAKHEVVFTGNIDFLTNYLKNNAIDGIIHLATKYVSEHKNEDIKDIINSNIYLGTAILDAACQAGVKWFINTGTIWQNYNVPDYSDEYCPVNLYAASKQAFMTIAKYFTEISPIKFTTIKLCDTYGPNDTRRKIMDLFAHIATTGQSLDMSKGEQLIDIVHVNKVVEAFEKLIEILTYSDSLPLKEYVVSSRCPITLKELAKEYEVKNNVKLNINWGARPYRQREVMKPYVGIDILSI